MDVIVSEFVERFVYVEINVYLQLLKVVSKSLSSYSHHDNLVYVKFTVTNWSSRLREDVTTVTFNSATIFFFNLLTGISCIYQKANLICYRSIGSRHRREKIQKSQEFHNGIYISW